MQYTVEQVKEWVRDYNDSKYNGDINWQKINKKLSNNSNLNTNSDITLNQIKNWVSEYTISKSYQPAWSEIDLYFKNK